MGSKIATCCYCGTRAALVLRGRERHELSCASCGAPLTRLKAMPAPERPAPQPAARAAAAPVSRRRPAQSHAPQPRCENTHYRRRRRKPLLSRVLEEVWDAVEDILD